MVDVADNEDIRFQTDGRAPKNVGLQVIRCMLRYVTLPRADKGQCLVDAEKNKILGLPTFLLRRIAPAAQLIETIAFFFFIDHREEKTFPLVAGPFFLE